MMYKNVGASSHDAGALNRKRFLHVTKDSTPTPKQESQS